jgi:pyruvate ferredoxin oxidoreductase gamma subunit/2-oxoisovalerate ferredoxin oxidoreductase gamma subunit
MLNEVRLHGSGGQGVVVSGELMAIAASYEDKFCRAFPLYGAARRGSAVVAFVQIGSPEEATRAQVYTPKYLFILDPKMVEASDVVRGLKTDGVVVANSNRESEEVVSLLKVKLSRVGVVDATAIGLEVLGRPIPNTALLGAFARTTGLISLESIKKAIRKRFKGADVDLNVRAAEMGSERVRIKEF